MGVPAPVPRRAARHQPRPRTARRGDHPRAPPRPPDRDRRRPHRRVQGHVHASTARPGPRTRSAWPRRRPGRPRRSPGCRRFVDRFGAKATKAAMAHSIEKRIARLEADKVDGSAGRPRRAAACASRRRRRCGQHGDRGRRAAQGLRRPAGVRATSASTSAAASACSCSGSTAPARPACCGSSPARPRPTSARSSSATRCTAGYYAQEHDNLRTRRVAARQHPREVPPGVELTETAAARAARHVRAVRRARCSRRPARCRAARRPSSRWRC